MRITQIETPDCKAEGTCGGFPYNTELVSSQGVHIHFWVGNERDDEKIKLALHKARGARDVVKATWSFGQPLGFWAKEDIV